MNQHSFQHLTGEVPVRNLYGSRSNIYSGCRATLLIQTELLMPSAEKAELDRRLWSRIRRRTFARLTVARGLWVRMSLAATVALAVGIGWYVTRPGVVPQAVASAGGVAPKGVVQIRNTSAKARQVTLKTVSCWC